MDGTITYEENGFPVELNGRREVERAVRLGRLRADTIVRHYAADGSVTTGRADTITPLRPLLAPDEPVETPPPPPPPVITPPVAVVPSAPPVPEPEAEESRFWHESEEVVSSLPPPQVFAPAPAPAPRRRSGAGWWWLAAFAVIGLVLAVWGIGRNEGAPPTDETATTEAAAEGPLDEVGTAQDYWAMRDATVRKGPGVSTAALGMLKRGEPIRAVAVRGSRGLGDWARIEGGGFAGGYVWLTNMGAEERPALAEALDRAARLADEQTAYGAPNFSAVEQATLTAGSSVQLIGRTGDGWWEIALQGGGVGYLPPPAIAAGCVGADCRVVTSAGWGGIEAGMPVAAAMAAAGLQLATPGRHDESFDDDPDRLRACNVYNLVGGPSNVSVFVEDGVVTSIGVGLNDGGAEFRTDRGIRLGDSEDAVRDAYPRLQERPSTYSDPPDKDLFFRDDGGRGIKFTVAGGRVVAIAAGGKSIEYVEGCL